MNKLAGIYARVSTNKDQTVAQQLAVLEDFCEKADFTIVKEYIDEGISAFKKNRPAFNELLEDVHKRKINVIVVFRLDRFSRSMKELVNTIDKVKSYGADFISYSEKEFDTTTSTGKLIFHIIGAIAEFERNLISERTKLKLSYLKSIGKRLGRPIKFDLEQILSLRKNGASLNCIASELNCDKSTVSKALKRITI